MPDSSCVGTKIIPDRASVQTEELGDFGAITVTEQSCARRADLESGALHIE